MKVKVEISNLHCAHSCFTVPKGKGQWRKDRNKGQDHLNWRPLDQDYQRQFKNSSGRREGSSGTPPQRYGGIPDKRPQPRSCFPQKKTPKVSITFFLFCFQCKI